MQKRIELGGREPFCAHFLPVLPTLWSSFFGKRRTMHNARIDEYSSKVLKAFSLGLILLKNKNLLHIAISNPKSYKTVGVESHIKAKFLINWPVQLTAQFTTFPSLCSTRAPHPVCIRFDSQNEIESDL